MSTKKVKIFTPYGEKPPRKSNCAGNRMEPEYRERYDENGHPYLEKVGEKDTYAIIQSHKEECDINLLWQKYVAGDMGVINQGVYADISEMPQNYHEMVNYINAQRERFNALSAEIKQKFENSFEVWATAAGTNDWLEKMGLSGKKEEVKAPNGEPKQ